MKRFIPLLALPIVGMMAQAPTVVAPAVHGPAVTRAVEASRDANLKIDKKGAVDAKQVDRVLERLFDQYRSGLAEWKIARGQAEQSGSTAPITDGDEMFGLQIRYFELFPTLTDDALLPVTDAVLNDAPESTFVGLTLYRKNGSDIGRVTDKVKRWQPDYTSAGGRVYPSHYEVRLLAVNGDVLNSPVYTQYFKWADIKSKIAFDESVKSTKRITS